MTLSLLILALWGSVTESNGQELRDAFRKVEQAVVIVRTEQKGLAPFPQQGMVSLNGLGSGVLISNDGKCSLPRTLCSQQIERWLSSHVVNSFPLASQVRPSPPISQCCNSSATL